MCCPAVPSSDWPINRGGHQNNCIVHATGHLTETNLPTSPVSRYYDNGWDGVMAKHTQLAITPRDRFLEAAQRELTAFEEREREFSRKEKKERAEELQLPVLKREILS